MRSKKIVNIKKVGKKEVYDISVEDNKNFLLSNGILSHNSETKGLVSGQQDLTILGRLPSERDRQEATTQLYRDGLMKKNQVSKVGTLDPGQFIVCPTGKHAFEQYFLLPKTRFWEEGNSNFYSQIWKNEVDKWTSFKEQVDELKEDFKLELSEIEEEKKRKKREQQRRREEEKKREKEKKKQEKEKEEVKKMTKKQNNSTQEQNIKSDENSNNQRPIINKPATDDGLEF